MRIWYRKNWKWGVVYDGSNREWVVSVSESQEFYEKAEVWESVIVKVYGKIEEIRFSNYIWNGEDVSKETYEEVLRLWELGYIDDETVWVWRAIINEYVVESDGERWRLVEREKEEWITTVWREDEWELIMMKEELMGYKNDSIRVRMQKWWEETEVQIGQDYEVDVKGEKYDIEGNYTAALRYIVLNKMLETWNADPRNRNHQREKMLQRWQADFLKRMGWVTICLVPRRSGKTCIMALEVLKELLGYNYKSWTRPRTVLYITKDYDAVGQVMDYINTMIEWFEGLKQIFKYSESNHELEIVGYDEHGNKKTISQCKFFSALWKLPGVGDAADAVFIDEAMLVPTRIKDKLMSIVTHEWARFLAMSTFYGDDEDGIDKVYRWPIEMCLRYEKESSKIDDIDSHIINLFKKYKETGEYEEERVGIRYTIDDVEVIKNKEIAKEELVGDWDRYMRELYCREGKREQVYNYENAIIETREEFEPMHRWFMRWEDGEKMIEKKFDRIILGYDPAQTGDISALVAVWYERRSGKISVIKERNLNQKDKTSYMPQIQGIKMAEDELKVFDCPIVRAMDSTHPAVCDVMEWAGIRFQYLYFWIWGDVSRRWVRNGEERIPKWMMIEAMKIMFENNKIDIWSSSCKELVHELGIYVEFKSEWDRSKYGNKGKWHDDMVTAMTLACWTLWDHYGLKNGVYKSVEEETKEEDPLGLRPINQIDVNVEKFEGVENSFWY